MTICSLTKPFHKLKVQFNAFSAPLLAPPGCTFLGEACVREGGLG